MVARISLSGYSSMVVMGTIAAVAVWASTALVPVLWGFFIGGMCVTIVSMFLLGASMGHSESDASGGHDHDHDTSGHDHDHDMSGHDHDHDVGGHDHDAGDHDLDHGMDHDHDHDMSGHDHDHGHDGHGDVHVGNQDGALASDKGQNAPFLMLFASYMMFSGVIGISLVDLLPVNLVLALVLILIPPLFLNKIVQVTWRRITRSETYVVPATLPLLGKQARVSIVVDFDGGVVKIDAPGTPLGYQGIPVFPLHTDKTFKPGDVVYICDISRGEGKRFYLVDDDPRNVRKRKQVH